MLEYIDILYATMSPYNLLCAFKSMCLVEDKSDYEKIEAFDTISTLNLNEFGPTNNINLSLNKPDGSTYVIKTIHTFSENQISWFKAGSALNLIADQLN